MPGLSYGDDVGSFTFTPTATLQAIVACTGPMAPDPGSGSAQVTVYPAGTPPIVTADFYPSRIYKGQSSTLRWSSKLATSCSSTGAVSISGTSGSRTITATSDQTVTITCVGSGGQSSRAATLTAVDRPPIVHASFSPWSLDGPGWATFSWSSSYATHCNRGGTWGSQWSYYTSNTSEWVTCYGPGGTASAWDMLIVNSTAQANPEEKKAANPQLAALGFDVASPSILSSTHDFNDDGNIDALVVDAARGEGYVVLGGPLSQSRIAKVIPDISTLDQVNNITVVGKAGDAIMVDVNR
ncbi:MAG: hypothetical protein JNN30_00010 [Rhodanobacteraceae bacterium]|nr:hypothetical protein [Rhodanobacteraceae bacterium]